MKEFVVELPLLPERNELMNDPRQPFMNFRFFGNWGICDILDRQNK